jgi:glycosyltransferase involved in cell wall biosynthesis
MPTILTVIDYYLPSYKAGGPVRSIANAVEMLGDEFEFKVVTSDRDLGDGAPFDKIRNGQWTSVGKAQVLYLSPKEKRLFSWKRLLNTVPYDLIYLNSFFSTLSVMTLFLHRTGQIPDKPILLAARGELSQGALSLKWFKKRVYILLTKTVMFYDKIHYHASSQYELAEIVSALNIQEISAYCSTPLVHVAIDLPRKSQGRKLESARSFKQAGSARVVFLSRVARKKNLDVALRLLATAKGKIVFDIWGPLEDSGYWKECQELIKRLPSDIVVKYKGIVHPDHVADVFSCYHLFLFPTRNENFGHVILESFSAGCLVLTSDATVWRGLEAREVGWDIPLSDMNRYSKALSDLLAMDETEFSRRSMQARNYGLGFVNDPDLVEAKRTMFLTVANNTK